MLFTEEDGWVARLELFLDLYPQLLQLRFTHRCRRIHHQVDRPRRLRKWDHFAQTFGASKDHHNAIQPQGNPTVWGRAVLKRFKEEPKTGPCFLIAHAKRLKNFLLNVLAVNTNRA